MGAMAREHGMSGAPAARHQGLALWIAWLAGPLAWAIHLSVSYMIVSWVCATGHHVVLHVLTAGTFLMTTGGFLLAWRLWRAGDFRWPDEGGTRLARMQFMAVSGVVLSVLFAMMILMEGVPSLLLDACR